MPIQDTEDSGSAEFSIQYGADDQTTIYVENDAGDALERVDVIPRDLFVEQRLNERDTLEGEIQGTDQSRAQFVEGERIYVFPDSGVDPLVFILTDVEYDTDYKITIEGRGIEHDLARLRTSRTEYTNVAGDNIVTSEIPSSFINYGTIESAPVTSVRTDYDNGLELIASVASAIKYDWYIDQKESDGYLEDYLYFVERRGSETSVKTFTVGDDIAITKKRNDREVLANDFKGLGYGDGENQLEVDIWDAGPRTLLTQKLDSGDTTSFTVGDTSQFGSSGDSVTLRVGTEVISGSITDGTTISISARGQNDYEGNSTEDMDHYEGVGVWLVENSTTGDGPYTPEDESSASPDSSIGTYGSYQDEYTNRKIVDRSALELSTFRQLRARDEPPVRMKVRTTSINPPVDLGDDVTIVDNVAETNDDFRVVGFDRELGAGRRSTKLVVSNKPKSLVEELRDLANDQKALDRHMQGSTTSYSQNFGDNADSSHPLSTKIYVPSDAIEVNKLKLKFDRESFRGYIKQNLTSGQQTDRDVVEEAVLTSDSVSLDERWSTVANVSPSSAGSSLQAEITHYGSTVDLSSGNTEPIKIRLWDETTETAYPSTEGVTTYLQNSDEARENIDLEIPKDVSGNTIYVQAKCPSLPNEKSQIFFDGFDDGDASDWDETSSGLSGFNTDTNSISGSHSATMSPDPGFFLDAAKNVSGGDPFPPHFSFKAAAADLGERDYCRVVLEGDNGSGGTYEIEVGLEKDRVVIRVNDGKGNSDSTVIDYPSGSTFGESGSGPSNSIEVRVIPYYSSNAQQISGLDDNCTLKPRFGFDQYYRLEIIGPNSGVTCGTNELSDVDIGDIQQPSRFYVRADNYDDSPQGDPDYWFDDFSVSTSEFVAGFFETLYWVEDDHFHNVTDDGAYGLFTPDTESDVDVTVKVDGNVVSTITDVSVGDSIDPVDISSDLSEPIAGEDHELVLEPTGRCRLNSTFLSKFFIKSDSQ